jgi:hypothetical protein
VTKISRPIMPLVVAFALAACGEGGGASAVPGATNQGATGTKSTDTSVKTGATLNTVLHHHRIRVAATPRYVYVSDGETKSLLVYQAGVTNPPPIRTVSLGDFAEGVATDHEGNVYVALFNTSVLDVFPSGAAGPPQTITASLYKPTGVTVDTHDNFYVANHCPTGGCQPYVSEFAHGATAPFAKIYTPAGSGNEGIATDAADNLFVDTSPSIGGYVFEYTNGVLVGEVVGGLATCDGIAFDPQGNLNAASAATLETFQPPSWNLIKSTYYGSGQAIRLLTSGPDGSLYIPFTAGTTASSVLVIPANGLLLPYRITSGITSPLGATAGI